MVVDTLRGLYRIFFNVFQDNATTAIIRQLKNMYIFSISKANFRKFFQKNFFVFTQYFYRNTFFVESNPSSESDIWVFLRWEPEQGAGIVGIGILSFIDKVLNYGLNVYFLH